MDTVLGHYTQKNTLVQNKDVNVWLLCGKRGIGKATLAFAFARSIVASRALDAHPDVMIIEDKHSPIGIEKIRNMKHFLYMSTITAKRKIVIFDSVDGLNPSTTNSMLKILEEPPKSSLILLVSHNFYSVPIVVRSRCVTLRFTELTHEETRQVISMKFPHLGLEDKAVSLYPGIPGMVTESIESEIAIYENFISLIRSGKKSDALENLLETDLPIHKIEYLGLKAMYDSISGALELYKSNTYHAHSLNIPSMIDKYFKMQDVIATSKKLHAHREATIFRIAEIISSVYQH